MLVLRPVQKHFSELQTLQAVDSTASLPSSQEERETSSLPQESMWVQIFHPSKGMTVYTRHFRTHPLQPVS